MSMPNDKKEEVGYNGSGCTFTGAHGVCRIAKASKKQSDP